MSKHDVRIFHLNQCRANIKNHKKKKKMKKIFGKIHITLCFSLFLLFLFQLFDIYFLILQIILLYSSVICFLFCFLQLFCYTFDSMQAFISIQFITPFALAHCSPPTAHTRKKKNSNKFLAIKCTVSIAYSHRCICRKIGWPLVTAAIFHLLEGRFVLLLFDVLGPHRAERWEVFFVG